jgi:hypothetical protein
MSRKTTKAKAKTIDPTPVSAINCAALSSNQREVLRTALTEFVYTRCADLDVFTYPDSEEEGVFSYINSRYADHSAAFRAAKHRKVLHRVRVAKALVAQLNNPYIFDPTNAKTEFVAPSSYFKVIDTLTTRQHVAKGV